MGRSVKLTGSELIFEANGMSFKIRGYLPDRINEKNLNRRFLDDFRNTFEFLEE